MNYDWVEDYLGEVGTEVENLMNIAEASYGTRPRITIEAVPMVELRVVGSLGAQVTVPYGALRVDQDTIAAKHKPKLLAKKLARDILPRLRSGSGPSLRVREWYLQTKEQGRPYSYRGYTPEQLEAPPTPIERALHPGIAARVRRLIASTAELPPPEEYIYPPLRYAAAATTTWLPGVTYAVNPVTFTTNTANTTATYITMRDNVTPTFNESEEDLPDDDA